MLTSELQTTCDASRRPSLVADAESVRETSANQAAVTAPASPTLAHAKPLPTEATAKQNHNRGGAQSGNGNARRHGHRGSNLHPSCKPEQNAVATSMKPVLSAVVAKHGSPLPPAAENLVMQIRRAHERDRVAARLLRTLKDLKGSDLGHDQQVAQREVQAAALRTIETCLTKLGLGVEQVTATTGSPWAAFDATRKEGGAFQRPATASKPTAATETTTNAPATQPRAGEKQEPAFPSLTTSQNSEAAQ